MRKRAIDLTREQIAFCYRPSPGKPPIKMRHSRTWPKGIVSVLTVGIVAAALLAVLLFAPTRAAVSKLFTSFFAVRQVVIETSGDLNTGGIAGGFSSSLGRSLLDISAQDVAAAFDLVPRVRSTACRRLFPSTLVVSVQERKPRFVTELDGRWWGLSEDGVVLSLPGGRERTPLPSVKGLTFDCSRPGGRVENVYFPDLVALCDSLSTLAPELLGPASRILVRDRIEVRVWPRTGDPALVFSLKDPERQIRKYVVATSEIDSQKGEFISVDLRFGGQIVLRKNSG